MSAPAPEHLLEAAAWLPAQEAHAARADTLTAAHRDRRSRGEKHAVEDFLFDYYSVRPGALRRWHPGVGVRLAPGEGTTDLLADRARWRWHRADDGGAVGLDARAFLIDRGDGVRWLGTLLARTAARAPQLGCLGMHEWAMVYRAEERRHTLPLRLGREGTDAVVEANPVRCSHIDAFRFFTAPARPLNRLQPTRANQPDLEQPGCLHANMDLLKAALKLGPACPGTLLLDCFELARDIRALDMEASPYDVTSLGLAPVAVETAAGRAEYVERQRSFAERADPLRRSLLSVTTALLGPSPDCSPAPVGAHR
ncbi:3-methyladenine DNA glycosylase [Georgenia sp. 10Sc9-8]|uniref:3-methyladenine DNA glycosylase n=1 Tax=Georgenia halotolerans TaxID=3028317 RepID=A0ABT5U1D7_9MICO|nr:3-methyladenine DNA glycosylase [Georgenia halotolerans]